MLLVGERVVLQIVVARRHVHRLVVRDVEDPPSGRDTAEGHDDDQRQPERCGACHGRESIRRVVGYRLSVVVFRSPPTAHRPPPTGNRPPATGNRQPTTDNRYPYNPAHPSSELV